MEGCSALFAAEDLVFCTFDLRRYRRGTPIRGQWFGFLGQANEAFRSSRISDLVPYSLGRMKH